MPAAAMAPLTAEWCMPSLPLGRQGPMRAAPLRWQSDYHSQTVGYTVLITLKYTRGAAYQYQIFPHPSEIDALIVPHVFPPETYSPLKR